MDEINYKIQSTNPMVSSEAVHLLTKAIMKTLDENKNSTDLQALYDVLKDKCGCEDAMMSSTACRGILALVDFGYLTPNDGLNLCLSILLTAKTYSGITSTVSRLIEMIVVSETEEGTKWSINHPVHPLITAIKLHPSAIPCVFDEIKRLCSHDSRIYGDCIKVLRPVFMWILCLPDQIYPTIDHHNAIQLILSLNEGSERTSLIFECLGWQQLTPSKCQYTFETYSVIIEWAIANKSYDCVLGILPALANVAHYLTVYCKNPKPCFALIRKLVSLAETLKREREISNIINTTACMLAETVQQCPVVYIDELFKIFVDLQRLLNCPISISVMIVGILKWNYNRNLLTVDCNDQMRTILDSLRNFDRYDWKTSTENNEVFNYFKAINRRIYKAHEICLNLKRTIRDKSAYDDWLIDWKSERFPRSQYVLYLQGLLIMDVKRSDVCFDKMVVLKLISECLNEDEMIGQLPIALYYLKLSKDPVETSDLLQSLPVLASKRENIPVVLGILKSLESNKFANSANHINNSMSAFVINLYMKLVEKQSRCYSNLHAILAKSIAENAGRSWELLIAQSAAIKQICEGRIVNSTEVLPIISELMRHSTGPETAAACCLCLKAVGALWRKEIVDLEDSWRLIGPKFINEERDIVKISICELLGIIPEIYTDVLDHTDFIDAVMQRLWKYIMNTNESVGIAAFTALSKFKLETMNLSQIPDVYKTGIKFPANYSKLALNENSKPEDVLNYIPSIVWGNMFKYTDSKLLPGVTILCRELMEREISAYRSGVYNTNVAEPDSAKSLPLASVVGGVMEFLRKELIEDNVKLNAATLECLKCMAMSYSKPFPPLNWCFLYEILQDDTLDVEMQTNVLRLLSRQCEISPSAVKIMADYIESSNNDDKTRIFFSILPSLIKCSKLKKLSIHVENCTDYAYGVFKSNDAQPQLFLSALDSIGTCIISDRIENGLKTSLIELALKYWKIIAIDSAIWEPYSKLCSQFPDESLNMINTIDEKSCSVRKVLALDADDLIWLNDVIDAGINDNGLASLAISSISNVLMKINRSGEHLRVWFAEFIIKIRYEFNSGLLSENSIVFLCNIVITSVITLADKSRTELDDWEWKLESFPQYLCSFFDDESNISLTSIGNQIIEWLVSAKHSRLIPKNIERCFNLALMSCRHTTSLNNREMWPKYAAGPSVQYISNNI